jgi:hypothetical protein
MIQYFTYKEHSMSKYTTQSEAKRALAAGQTHGDLHPGHGVFTLPTHDDIAARAYEIYVESGRTQGHCKQNWQQAEHDLRTGDRRP